MRDGDWARDLREPQRLEQYAEDLIHCLQLKSDKSMCGPGIGRGTWGSYNGGNNRLKTIYVVYS